MKAPKRLLVLMTLALWTVPVPSRADIAPCTGAPADGGDWATHSQNVAATNLQDNETAITAANVATMQLAWTVAANGYFSQPIVAGNCMYLTPFNATGTVEALDIHTGEIVWSVPAPLPGQTFAATVAGSTLYMNFPNTAQPKAAALDADTGALEWTSPEITFGYPANQLSSARVFDGIQIVFTAGPDFDPKARPGYALLDATDGSILHAQTVTPTPLLDDGFGGGSVWGTPSIDPESKYLFVGTGNPDSRTSESNFDNAIIKIDLARARDAAGAPVASTTITNPNFGTIVDVYKGQADTMVDNGYNQPVCSTLGHQIGTPLINPVCLQMDIDFGNGPALWHDKYGRLMLSEIQKSGELHTVFGDTLERAWTMKIAPDSTFTITGGNNSYIATDGTTLYVLTNPGVVWAIDGMTGAVKWVTPTTGTSFAYGNLALANGMLFGLADDGPRAWDAATGTLLWANHDALANSLFCSGATGSIAIAHHMLFATCPRNELTESTSAVIAFRLP